MDNNKPEYYQSKYDQIQSTRDKKVFAEARRLFNQYQRRRRLPYVRSAYFSGQKVFLNVFWSHLNSKLPSDRKRRVVFLPPALDLIKNSTTPPIYEPKNSPGNEYYRFFGKTKSGTAFCVQIMKDKKSNRYFLSCFPAK
jgi:hypothetical protein